MSEALANIPTVVRILSQRGAPSASRLAPHMPGGSLDQGDIRFTVDAEPADVVVVLNYLKYDTTLVAKRGYFWAWHNEPINRKPFARGLDRIFTHEVSSDPRVSNAPPILDWWVGKSWDELNTLHVPEKKRGMSAIASDKTVIAGHRRRHAFVNLVEKTLPEIEVFGKGRPNALGDKWDGLAPFKYSVAIENTSKRDYWTEKIADCFLSYTVPIYFGATNIADYFPEDSFIWLPLGDPKLALQTLESVLENDSWNDRLSALHEARKRVLREYCFWGQLTTRIRREAHQIQRARMTSRRVHGRRVRPRGWVRNAGVVGNIRQELERRARRSQ